MTATSYLTDEELRAVQTLHRRAPYVVRGVRDGVFSVARFYGGITYQGCGYLYIPASDELVRDDVMRWVARRRRKEAK